jgi:ubiquinone biosynthesis protein
MGLGRDGAVAISLRPQHLGRYKDLARLLLKYGRSDLVRDSGLADALGPSLDDVDAGSSDAENEAEGLADDLEALGPTYVKLGQLLSTRADLLPAPYLEALARLQDDVEAFPVSEVTATISEELGADVSDLFAELDPEPMASASIGQVHRAEMRDGRKVVVKVQRPGIREQVADDLEVLADVASFLDDHTDAGRTFGFGELLDQFRRSLHAELDYRQEAGNLVAMRRHLEDFERIVVPRPIENYTTSKVLTMELVEGKKVTSLGPLGMMEIDGAALLDELFHAYLQQILADGFVHADPHPGNILITPDGRLGLIDLGMVASIDAQMQEHLVKLLLAVGEGHGAEVAELAEEMGLALPSFDRRLLRRTTVEVVSRHHGQQLADVGAGTVLAELMQICANAGLRPPPELSLVGKALLNLDEVARTLDPEFRPQEALRRHAQELFEQQAWRSASSGSVMRTALEAKEFAEQLPRRANRLLDALADGELTIKVDAIDEEELLRDLEKLGNRLTTGVVLAAIIIGAAMTMSVETDTTILGYPAISIVFFVAAALGGATLVVSTLVGDARRRRRQSSPD